MLARQTIGSNLATSEIMTKKPSRSDIAAIIALLAEMYPKAFFVWEARRKPLKIGIHVDIIAKVNGAIKPFELYHALAAYCNNLRYLGGMHVGAVRIDLDGNPAGVVSAEEGRIAHEKFSTRLLKAANRNKRAINQPKKIQQSSSGPPKLGLSDLKKVAALRKQCRENQTNGPAPRQRSAGPNE
jgi:ProP effector